MSEEKQIWRVSDVENDPFGYRQACEYSNRSEDNDRAYAEYYIWCRTNLLKQHYLPFFAHFNGNETRPWVLVVNIDYGG